MAKRAPARTNGQKAQAAEAPSIDVVIKIECLTWEDMYLMTSIQGNDGKFTKEIVADIRALFNRVVEGGAAAVPIVHTKAVMEKLGEAMAEMGNPGN
jgi:hypothetical protein